MSTVECRACAKSVSETGRTHGFDPNGGKACSERWLTTRIANSPPTPSTPSILIVEDEYGLAELLRDMLTEVGYAVSLAINGRLALEVLCEREIHLVPGGTLESAG